MSDAPSGPSKDLVAKIELALREFLHRPLTLDPLRGGLSTRAWYALVSALHGAGIDARWDDIRPHEVSVYEHRRLVGRLTYDCGRRALVFDPVSDPRPGE